MGVVRGVLSSEVSEGAAGVWKRKPEVESVSPRDVLSARYSQQGGVAVSAYAATLLPSTHQPTHWSLPTPLVTGQARQEVAALTDPFDTYEFACVAACGPGGPGSMPGGAGPDILVGSTTRGACPACLDDVGLPSMCYHKPKVGTREARGEGKGAGE